MGSRLCREFSGIRLDFCSSSFGRGSSRSRPKIFRSIKLRRPFQRNFGFGVGWSLLEFVLCVFGRLPFEYVS